MHIFRALAEERLGRTINRIRELAECESPTSSADGVNRAAEILASHCEGLAQISSFPGGAFGNHHLLNFRLTASGDQKRILGIGHADTVWPLGTLDDMPVREEGGRLWGPGVLDMKAGLAFWIEAVQILRDTGFTPKRPLALLLVSDEEVGSPSSRVITEEEARKSSIALVLEPGTGLVGKLKTARKGVGRYRLTVDGVASHAGVDFENGASAILELARQIGRLPEFVNLDSGVTVNPGVISGGTASNVIAAQAQCEIDVRVRTAADADQVDAALRSLQAADKRCRLTWSGGLNRPPMERTAQIADLFGRAQQIAKTIGIELEESATGGGSDGNFTAAIGVPTLDGLGAVGEGAHARNESILIDRIPERVALLAALLAEL